MVEYNRLGAVCKKVHNIKQIIMIFNVVHQHNRISMIFNKAANKFRKRESKDSLVAFGEELKK